MHNARIVTMNKEMVDSLLAMNTSNRRVKPAVVERYARDMASGYWPLTSQGIGVSNEGVLLDGQHRLLAMQKAGYPPLEVLLVTGLHPNSQRVIDQQSKRTARDIFRLSFDATIAATAPAILQVLARFEPECQTPISSGKSGTLTIDEMYDLYELYYESIEPVCRIEGVRGFLSAAYMAAGAFMLHKKQTTIDIIAEFFDQVKGGENLNKKMPAYHLRNYVISSKSSGSNGPIQRERYLKTKKAIAAFASKQEMSRLVIQ